MRKFLFYSAAVVTLLVLAVVAAGWLAQRKWERQKGEFLASGALETVESLTPPLIPPEQNFAAIPLLQAQWQEIAKERPKWETVNDFKYHVLPELNLAREGTRYVAFPFNERWALLDLSVVPPTLHLNPAIPGEPPAQAILRACEPARETLAALTEGLQRPGCRFPVRYERGLTAVQPNMHGFRRMAQVLGLRAVALIEAGRSDEAAQDVVSLLRLGAHYRRDPGLLRNSLGSGSSLLAVQCIWQGLVRQLWTDRHLQAFERELVEIDLFRDFHRALRMEVSVGARSWEDSLRSSYTAGEMQSFASALGERSANFVFGKALLYPCLSAHVRVSAMLKQSLPGSRPSKFDPAAFEAANREVDASGERWDGMMLAISLPMFDRSMHRQAHKQARIELCLLAVRLERTRLTSGRYPAALDGLTPNDFMTGQPPRYEVSADGSRFRILRQPWRRQDGEDGSKDGISPWEWYSNLGGPEAWK